MRTPRLHLPAPGLLCLLPAMLCTALLTGCGKGTEATGPNGDNTGNHLVVFTSDRGRASGDQGIALYDLDVNGFRAMPGIDAAGSEADPCLSNDGNFVVFSANRSGGTTGTDLYLYDRFNEGLLSTPNLNTTRDESWPRFTYDSAKLAFVRALSTGEKRVNVYEPLGDTLVPLPGLSASVPFNDDMPAPNVDGSRIAFVSDRNGTNDVLIWNRTGGLSTPSRTASAANDTEPSLSANGRWLAFASDRAGGVGGFDVYLYDVQGDSLVALPGLNSTSDDRHPSVSADGDVIVFQSTRSGGGGAYDLYRYTLTGGAVLQPAAFKDASNDIQPYLRWR